MVRFSNSILFLEHPRASIMSINDKELHEMGNDLEEAGFEACIKYPTSDVWITSSTNPSKFRQFLQRSNYSYRRIYYTGIISSVINAVRFHDGYCKYGDFILNSDSVLYTENTNIVFSGLGIVGGSFVIGCDSRNLTAVYYLWKTSKLFNSEICFCNVENIFEVQTALEYFERLNSAVMLAQS